MSATAVLSSQVTTNTHATAKNRRLAALCALLTLGVPLIHGYHPDAEDGGIYLAGIQYCLHPQSYARWNGFVTAHVKFSPFAHAVAALAQIHPPALMSILFALYLLTTFLTLFASGCIAARLTTNESAQRWAVVLLAACLTIPVAGTSLMLMDPYVTARSLALPCVLAAIAAALRPRCTAQWVIIVALCLAAALLLHPLSGGYGTVLVSVLFVVSMPEQRTRSYALAAIAACALGACMALRAAWSHAPAGYSAIAQSRTYWMLSNWAWYELLGLAAPLVLFLLLTRSAVMTPAGIRFARSLVLSGLLSLAISLLFVHADGPSFAVARVQPLRMFLYLYLALPLCGGIWLALRIHRKPVLFAMALAMAGAMFATQRSIYPASAHVEWPWATPANPWQQAFLWIRDNTAPEDAVAVDADYITEPGEDAHNIRAITGHSVPADVSKDGGITAIRPALTPLWLQGVALQRNLATLSDAQREQRLAPQSIAWLVLPATSHTAFVCPYRNAAVLVCRVPSTFVRSPK